MTFFPVYLSSHHLSSSHKDNNHIRSKTHPTPVSPYLNYLHLQWTCFQINSHLEVLRVRDSSSFPRGCGYTTQLITYPIACRLRPTEVQKGNGEARKASSSECLSVASLGSIWHSTCVLLTSIGRNFVTKKMDGCSSLFLSYSLIAKQFIVSVWRNQGSLCPLLPIFPSQKASLTSSAWFTVITRRPGREHHNG